MIKNIYKKMQCLVLILLLIPALIFAQNSGNITGKVADAKGVPVPYANVSLVGTTMGAAADIEGNYKVANVAAGNYTLRVTAIGYRESRTDVTVSAGGTSSQNFTLAEDVLQMEGVVITGTAGGTGVKKKDASFAITTMSAAELEQLSPPSTAAALELVPGVWSESSGGVAGANIFVRGLPSSGDCYYVY